MNPSRILVALQLTFIAVLLLLGGAGVLADWRLFAGGLLFLLLILHAVWAMRVRHVRVAPEPHAGAELCQRGIYRWVRHPMYTGTLGGFACVAAGAGTLLAWGLWLGLAAVLWAKLRREERLWLARSAGYADYMRRTKRLIPFVL